MWNRWCLVLFLFGACGFEAGTSPDAGQHDAASIDATLAIDAEIVDAEIPDADDCMATEICNGIDDTCDTDVDEGCVAPGSPVARFPWNGYTTGSVHATLGVDPLRPTFRWEAASGTVTHYELRLTSACSVASWRTCVLTAVPPISVSGTTHTLATDLTVLPATAMKGIGDRYYWTVQACNGAACSAPTAIRYVDVGRRNDDLNGDGYGDVVVGSAYAAAGTEGRAYLYFGGAAGLGTSPTTLMSTGDPNTDGEFGTAIATGDLNGDGFADLAIGAPGYSADREGAVCIYTGGMSGLTSHGCGWDANPVVIGGNSGQNVAIGDVDGDGYGDLVMSEPNPAPGRIWVFSGTSTVPSTTGTFIARPGTNGDNFGESMEASGDLNGDGFVDILAGAPATSGVDAAIVIPGSAAGPVSGSPRILVQPSGCIQFGFSLDVGDINGDGLADAAIGCSPGADPGAVNVFFGAIGGLATTPSITAFANPDTVGGGAFSRATLGDLNGDGYADLLVGAANNDIVNTNEGAAYVYLAPGGVLSTTPVTIEHPSHEASANFGSNLSLNHDFNGDGLHDLIIAAPQHTGTASQQGEAYVFHTTSAGAVGTSLTWSAPSPEAGGSYGNFLRH